MLLFLTLTAMRKLIRQGIDRIRSNPVAGILLLVALFVLVYFTFSRTRLTTNPLSRVITVERLVDAGTWAHFDEKDTTRFDMTYHIDAVMIEGKLYSSKPPLYPFIMAAQSWPIAKLFGWNFFEQRVTFIRYLTLLNQVLPLMLMLWVAFVWASSIISNKRAVNLLLLAMSFGTLVYGYAVTINNHTPAAVCFFISWYLVYRIRRDRISGIVPYVLAGLLAGMGGMFELQGLVFTLWLFCLVAMKRPGKSLIFLVFLAIPIILNLYLNYHISGDIRPFYLQSDLYKYEGSAWIEGNNKTSSRWVYLFHLLLGHHGLFSLSPVLVIGLLGMINVIRRNREDMGMEMLGLAVAMLIVILFPLTIQRNYGGYCVGMRWFIHFTPILMFPGIFVLEKLSKKQWGVVLVVVLAIFSLSINWRALYYEAFVQGDAELLWFSLFERSNIP